MSNGDKNKVEMSLPKRKCPYCLELFIYTRQNQKKCSPKCPEFVEYINRNRTPQSKADRSIMPFPFYAYLGVSTLIIVILMGIIYYNSGDRISYEFNYNLLKEVSSDCC